MSKQIKQMEMDALKRTFEGVRDLVALKVEKVDARTDNRVRLDLRKKGIRLQVVKNSLARRATEGTPLSRAFDESEGSLAVVWGAEDFVSLAKELVALHKKPEYEKFTAKGGLMEGERLTPEKVTEISKWPNRAGQISIVLGQILSPGSKLLSQITGPGGKLLSQVKKKSEGEEQPAS